MVVEQAVLIGDGFAQSIGTVPQLGLPSLLVHCLALGYGTKGSNNVRMDWSFFERSVSQPRRTAAGLPLCTRSGSKLCPVGRGYYRSTSADWLPSSRLFKR